MNLLNDADLVALMMRHDPTLEAKVAARTAPKRRTQ